MHIINLSAYKNIQISADRLVQRINRIKRFFQLTSQKAFQKKIFYSYKVCIKQRHYIQTKIQH